MNSRKYQYFEGNDDKKFNILKMKNYIDTKYEIDKELEKIILPLIKNNKLKILDACCGIGHITKILNKISNKSEILGIDQSKYLIDSANELLGNNNKISFETGDIYEIKEKYKKKFDISISWKTISWLPYYDQMLKDLIHMTKKYIFLSSLFYEGDIDFEIKIREFKKESGKKKFNAYYNVYSLPQLRNFYMD